MFWNGRTAMDGLSGSGSGLSSPGKEGLLAGMDPAGRTEYIRTARSMFFSLCSPRSVNSTGTLPRTWS
jgi:hypothetical protein